MIAEPELLNAVGNALRMYSYLIISFLLLYFYMIAAYYNKNFGKNINAKLFLLPIPFFLATAIIYSFFALRTNILADGSMLAGGIIAIYAAYSMFKQMAVK